MNLLKMRRKGAEDDVVGCLCVRIFFGSSVWRSGMAVSSGENDRKYDFIFGKETEKRK